MIEDLIILTIVAASFTYLIARILTHFERMNDK